MHVTKLAILRWLVLLSLALTSALGEEWDCRTPACDGHKAGFEWGMDHLATMQDCDVAGEHTNSPSFADGCKAALIVKERFSATREQLLPLFQAYELGKEIAKEGRVLPSDCEDAYKSLVVSVGSESLLPTPFRTGCLEIAKKQAKKIIKEDEEKIKRDEEKAKKPAREEAKHAVKTH
jgi:hypothetical protein